MFEVKEKPRMVERALLVGVETPQTGHTEAENLLEELRELVRNLRVHVVDSVIVRMKTPTPRLLLGAGKAAEIIKHARDLNCDCIVFDHELSPGQQRNWETESRLCVIDRQEVILDIFGERAHTREAVLQVDLARMEYNLPRLKRAWTHLSRQRGGGVTQRGEGEAQLELDQRMVRNRIARLKRELGDVVKQRAVQRKQRERIPVPTGAIVGYTNAGKSSLLNQLSGSGIYAANQLFATLDPTTRQLELPSGQKALLTDTVGFVRRLPHRLIDAFKATLEEAVVADFLVHVVDASTPAFEDHYQTTLAVLHELGADHKPTFVVFNKIDKIEGSAPRMLDFREEMHPILQVSAHTGTGLAALRAAIDAHLANKLTITELLIPYNRYDLISRLHDSGCIKEEKAQDQGVHIVGNIPSRLRNQVEPFLLNGSAAPPETLSRHA